jgi:PBSX family phage terminase large subunit
MAATRPEVNVWTKQALFLQSDSPTVAFQGGAGTGKTFALCLKALKLSQDNPGSRGMIVSASYRQLQRSVWPHLLGIGAALGLREKWEYRKSDAELVLPNGSVVWLASAENPESLLGADLAWLCGDEPALWKYDAFKYIVGRLRQPGFLTQAAFTFTPKGRNWAWEEFGQPHDGLEVIRASSLENPFVDVAYKLRLLRTYPKGSVWWRQEVEGDYVAYEGLVYGAFDQEKHVRRPPEDAVFVWGGLGQDWGWAHPGVLLAGRQDRDGVLWITEEVYEPEKSLDWWADQAARLVREQEATQDFCDPSEPGSIDHHRRNGVPAGKADNAVIPGIQAVASRLTSGKLFVSPDCLGTIRELLGYCWKRNRDGTSKPDEPEKVNDHAMDALRYLVMGVTNKREATILWV